MVLGQAERLPPPKPHDTQHEVVGTAVLPEQADTSTIGVLKRVFSTHRISEGQKSVQRRLRKERGAGSGSASSQHRPVHLPDDLTVR